MTKKVTRRMAADRPYLPPGLATSDTRQNILVVALRLFAEHGFEGASMRDIANEVGMKAASIYSHYASKEQLLLELLRFGHEEHNRRIRWALNAAQDECIAQLSAAVRAHVRMHTDYPMLAAVSNTELHALSTEAGSPVLALRANTEAMLAEVVRKGVQSGVFQVPHEWLAVAVIGGMGLRVAHWYTPDFELDGDGISDIYVEYALRVLGVSGTRPEQRT